MASGSSELWQLFLGCANFWRNLPIGPLVFVHFKKKKTHLSSDLDTKMCMGGTGCADDFEWQVHILYCLIYGFWFCLRNSGTSGCHLRQDLKIRGCHDDLSQK